MAVDTPARIAVLGAGPIGLEAALYGRYLGYDVDVYERGPVGENVLRWGHVRLFSPWRHNVSPLGTAALAAQDPRWRSPDPEALLAGRELAEGYLLPLAGSDLLAGSVQQQTEVVAVGRDGLLKGELAGDETRGDYPFRILVRDRDGGERTATADVVIDATGTYGNHNWLGQGGIPAVGEAAAAERIEYGLADIAGRDRQKYAGRLTLVVGAGYSAATHIVALAELAESAADTRVVWITRREPEPTAPSPVRRFPADRLPERDRVARAANDLAAAAASPVTHWPGTVVDSLRWQAALGRFAVELAGGHAGPIEVDHIIASVGYRPDRRLYAELQVHECYASGGPMKLAAALAGREGGDCLDQRGWGAGSLVNPEPNFYILGSKSYGRDSRFLLSVGLEQIRDVFSIIGDRAELDLYASVGANCR